MAVENHFENLCRICCCECSEQDKFVKVFDYDLLEKITVCLPITIHKEDNLPHEICQKCLNVIESSFELINKAKSSEKYFFYCLEELELESLEKVQDDLNDDTQASDSSSNKKKTLSLDLGGSFRCDLCGEQLHEASSLDSHIQEQHVNQSAPPNTEFTIHKICSLCGQLFDNEEIYVLHKCESHNKCSVCGKVLPSKCLLNRHIQHSCKQLYFCPHCHKSFSAKNPFMKHIQGHTGEESQFDCLACDRKRLGSVEVTEHTCNQDMEETSNSTKKYKCYICGQAYKRQLNLAKHCLQHEPKTKWKHKCEKCNDVFEKEKSLHTHYEKVHKIPKSWVCRYCGKSLATKLSVQIHERIHTQMKPYVCEWCGNAFRCNANLLQHQAMHTGIRKHECPFCEKTFSRPFFLKTHMRVHTGERPFQCDICERRFTQMTDMKRHRKRHEKAVSKQIKSDPNQNKSLVESGMTVFEVATVEETVGDSSMLPEVTYVQYGPLDTVELKVETSYD